MGTSENKLCYDLLHKRVRESEKKTQGEIWRETERKIKRPQWEWFVHLHLVITNWLWCCYRVSGPAYVSGVANPASYFLFPSSQLAQSDMQHMDAALLQYPDWKGHRL